MVKIFWKIVLGNERKNQDKEQKNLHSRMDESWKKENWGEIVWKKCKKKGIKIND